MHIKTLTAIGILLVSVAACDNSKPADTAVTPPADQTITAADPTIASNVISANMEAANAVSQPATTAPAGAENSIAAPNDAPRGNPDRRTSTTTNTTTEAK